MKKLLVLLSVFSLFCATVMSFPAGATENGGIDFTDVQPGAWSYQYIQKATELGFFDKASKFEPEAFVNRAQLAKAAYKIAEKKGLLQSGVQSGVSDYRDVPNDAWFNKYVITVTNLGIMTGYLDASGAKTGKFGPNDLVTRAQIAKVFSLSSGISLPVDARYTPNYPDVLDTNWFFDGVRRMTFHCVMTGYEDGRFGPNDTLTREQLAKIVVKTLNPGCGIETPTPAVSPTPSPTATPEPQLTANLFTDIAKWEIKDPTTTVQIRLCSDGKSHDVKLPVYQMYYAPPRDANGAYTISEVKTRLPKIEAALKADGWKKCSGVDEDGFYYQHTYVKDGKLLGFNWGTKDAVLGGSYIMIQFEYSN